VVHTGAWAPPEQATSDHLNSHLVSCTPLHRRPVFAAITSRSLPESRPTSPSPRPSFWPSPVACRTVWLLTARSLLAGPSQGAHSSNFETLLTFLDSFLYPTTSVDLAGTLSCSPAFVPSRTREQLACSHLLPTTSCRCKDYPLRIWWHLNRVTSLCHDQIK